MNYQDFLPFAASDITSNFAEAVLEKTQPTKPTRSRLEQKPTINSLTKKVKNLNDQLEAVQLIATTLRAKLGAYELNEKMLSEISINNRDIFNNWAEWKDKAENCEKISRAKDIVIKDLRSVIRDLRGLLKKA